MAEYQGNPNIFNSNRYMRRGYDVSRDPNSNLMNQAVIDDSFDYGHGQYNLGVGAVPNRYSPIVRGGMGLGYPHHSRVTNVRPDLFNINTAPVSGFNQGNLGFQNFDVNQENINFEFGYDYQRALRDNQLELNNERARSMDLEAQLRSLQLERRNIPEPEYYVDPAMEEEEAAAANDIADRADFDAGSLALYCFSSIIYIKGQVF